MLSAQQELLGALTIALPQPRAQQRRLLDATPLEPLLSAARHEGVAGLLYANLKRAGLVATLPPAPRRQMEAAYHRTAALNLQKQAALAALADALRGTDTTVIVLKGMALLGTLYDDPGLRATGDIDLWVAQHQRAALVTLLHGEGYCQQPHYPDTFGRGATTIDVHTHVLNTERIRTRAAILAAGEAPLLRRPAATAYGERVARLDAAAELLLLVLHLMKHNADRLLWLIEINELVAALDDAGWNDFTALADRMQQSRSVQRVAFLAELLLPHTVVPRLRQVAAAGALSRFERRALCRRATRGALPPWAPLWFFSAQRGMTARAATIFETLFPRPAVLRQVFDDDDAGIVRLYARRVGQLVGLVLR